MIESNPNDPLDDQSENPINAAIASLGEPLSVHRVAGRNVQVKVSIGLGLILFGIALNAVCYWFQGKFVHGLGHLLITPIVLGFGLVAQVIWNRGVTVYVYPAGVLRVSREKVETFLWEEIASIKVRSDSMKVLGERKDDGTWDAIWIEGAIPTVKLWTMWIELTRQDGTVLKLTPLLDDFADLSRRIQIETFQRIWPATWNQIQQGDAVTFGGVTVTNKEISLGKTKHLWTDLKTIKVKTSIIFLESGSFWKMRQNIVVWSVPNPHVLVALIDERTGNRFPVQSPPAIDAGKSTAETEEST